MSRIPGHSCDAFDVVVQILFRRVHAGEDGPPLGFGRAAVEVQQLEGEFPQPMILCPRGTVFRQRSREPLLEVLQPGLKLLRLLGGFLGRNLLGSEGLRKRSLYGRA